METNIINLKDDNNNAIIDAISAVLNELVATDLISDNNITGSYRNHNFDESKTYMFGMRPEGTPMGYPEEMVEVHIENQPKEYTIRMYAPGYIDKYFFDIYFVITT